MNAVDKIIRENDEEWVTNKSLSEELDIDKAAASRRTKTAIGRGYLKNLEDRRGRPAKLVLGEDMPEDTEILPAPGDLEEEVSGCSVDRDLQGMEHLPPLSTENRDVLAEVRELFAKDAGDESR